MDFFISILIGGLLLGSLYGLAACGLSFVFGVMTIINVAHAEFIMLGAYTTFWLWSLLKINTLLSIIPSMFLVFIICIFIYRITVRKVVGEMQLLSLILTFGISIFLWNFAQVFFTSTFRSVAYSTGSISLFGAFFPTN